MGTVWVITWRYSDGSGSGVTNSAYTSKEDAEAFIKDLEQHGDSMKTFELKELTLR